MPYIAKPIDRDQVTISTLDSMVEWDSTARVIDHFVDCLDCKAANTYFQRLRSRIKIKYPFVRHVSESVL